MPSVRPVPLPGRRLLLQTALALPLAARGRAAPGSNTAAQATVSASDPLRPRYHFQPPANWMNDPNGPIYWKGKYHLFYQYNPKGPVWAAPHWGHAVSADMIRWRHLPVAIAPTPGGPDADGVFSGTAIVADGRVTMMYTAVRGVPIEQATIKDARPMPLLETQCLATARDDGLTTWDKRPAPVIATPPPGMLVNGVRDPAPWRQGNLWYMVLGSGIAHHGGAILLYRSRDLVSWEFVKTFAERQPDPYSAFDPWEVWECPDFFSLGDRHVLIFSAAGKAYWQSGRFDEAVLTFYPERSGFLDYGNYYAPKTQLDAEGNRILWGWVPETRPESETRAAGWAGMMSLPRVLALNRDGDLIQTYLPGLRHLRGTGQTFEAGLPKKISLPDCAAEVEIRIPRGERDYTIEIAEGENQAWLPIAYRAASPELIWIEGRPLKAFAAGADIQIIRIFIDGSVIEVSVNKVMLTRRFYYAGRRRDAVLRLSSPAENGMELRLWSMTAA